MSKEKNKEIAAEYAASRGFKNIGELNDNIRTQLNSENPAERIVGERIAQQTVTDLLQLCLRQEIMNSPLPNYMGEITEKVFEGFLSEGNQKEYIADLSTGSTTIAGATFVPTEETIKKLESYTLQVYDSNKQLNAKAYQFMKEQTIPLGQWIPYFKSGKLNEYIGKLQTSLNKVYQLYIFDKVAKIIADKTKGKIVNGTATNLFDAWLEVLPHIDKMQQYNKDYNAEQSSQEMYASSPDDLVIFTSTKVRSLTKNGIKSQLFNAELLGANAKTLNDSNLKFLGNKITLSNQSTIITNAADEYIDDSTIIVVDMSRIRHLIQLDQAGTQFFQKNITEYISKNVWGIVDILPWCKKLVYTNTNLLSVPSQISE